MSSLFMIIVFSGLLSTHSLSTQHNLPIVWLSLLPGLLGYETNNYNMNIKYNVIYKITKKRVFTRVDVLHLKTLRLHKYSSIHPMYLCLCSNVLPIYVLMFSSEPHTSSHTAYARETRDCLTFQMTNVLSNNLHPPQRYQSHWNQT